MSLIVKENERVFIENIEFRNLILENNATVIHIFTSEERGKSLVVDLGHGASYKTIFLQKNNAYDLQVNLNKPKARVEISSVFLSDEKQCTKVDINHKASDTYSNMLFKGLSLKSGISEIDLKTTVAEDIKGIEAYQLLKGIVVDSKSKIQSQPLLDIYSDDVICTHGSAIGMLDEMQLFYLQSRGLSGKEARRILLLSFLQEIIDKVENKEDFLKYMEDII